MIKREGEVAGKVTEDGDLLPKLKDLALVGNQLEHLQRHMEGKARSVWAGMARSCPSRAYVVVRSRAFAALGFAMGICPGIYTIQVHAVPSVEKASRDYLWSLCKGLD
ncbi:SLC35A4 upstream open reading frame protein-like [Dasypus novemcinctus]|uniref:SLC35A4 upstream open reading frame protein-like n=1 Tax=Dasypus novemcinctus TaxID=9361 RepID=UPI000C819FC5|nr:SLC35A4 upstream open reading frame protein-like [Dasypus novemcinctus]